MGDHQKAGLDRSENDLLEIRSLGLYLQKNSPLIYEKRYNNYYQRPIIGFFGVLHHGFITKEIYAKGRKIRAGRIKPNSPKTN